MGSVRPKYVFFLCNITDTGCMPVCYANRVFLYQMVYDILG